MADRMAPEWAISAKAAENGLTNAAHGHYNTYDK